jgi:hypothetical protein
MTNWYRYSEQISNQEQASASVINQQALVIAGGENQRRD